MPRRGSLGMDAIRGAVLKPALQVSRFVRCPAKNRPSGHPRLPVWGQFLEPRPSVAGWQTGTMELDEAGENAAQPWTM
jgi:hypothetical protein